MPLARPIAALLIALLLIQPSCLHVSRRVAGGGAGAERAPEAEPQSIVFAREGRCPVDYPYCLTGQGYSDIEASLDDLDACEGHLKACQADLDAIPSEIPVVVEQHVEYRTPWYTWVLVGFLTACIPTGIGVGWYLGSRGGI